MKLHLYLATIAMAALAAVGLSVAPSVGVAQSIPTTAPSVTTSPTTSPTTFPTSVPTLVPVTVTVAAYATTGPDGQPATVIGTPPPMGETITASVNCPVFPKGDWVYNQEIYDAPVDPNSDAYMASYEAVAGNPSLSYSGNLNDWSLNIASPTDPRYSLVQTGTTTPINGITSFPFNPNYEWQGKHQTYTGDRHIMVLDPTNCMYYEGYTSTGPTPASWSVVNGAVQQASAHATSWNLTQTYPTVHPGSVNAGSVPQLAGMITPYDLASGCICHALNLDVRVHALRYLASVFPARGAESLTYDGPSQYATLSLPMGAHLRLKKGTYPCPSTASASDCSFFQEFVKSGQVFGFYVMDTGGAGGVVYALNQQNADGTWSFPYSTSALALVGQIHISDLEVVPSPGCTSTEACIK